MAVIVYPYYSTTDPGLVINGKSGNLTPVTVKLKNNVISYQSTSTNATPVESSYTIGYGT